MRLRRLSYLPNKGISIGQMPVFQSNPITTAAAAAAASAASAVAGATTTTTTTTE